MVSCRERDIRSREAIPAFHGMLEYAVGDVDGEPSIGCSERSHVDLSSCAGGKTYLYGDWILEGSGNVWSQ